MLVAVGVAALVAAVSALVGLRALDGAADDGSTISSEDIPSTTTAHRATGAPADVRIQVRNTLIAVDDETSATAEDAAGAAQDEFDAQIVAFAARPMTAEQRDLVTGSPGPRSTSPPTRPPPGRRPTRRSAPPPSTSSASASDSDSDSDSDSEEQTATTNQVSRSVAEAAGGSTETASDTTGVSTPASSTTEARSQTRIAVGELASLAADLRARVARLTA